MRDLSKVATGEAPRIRSGSIVIDVGINRLPSTDGGPMTIACLLANTVRAAGDFS